MEGLANYGSDEDYDDSPQQDEIPDEKFQHDSNSPRCLRIPTKDKRKDVDYEDTAMDLSEPEGGKGSDSPSHTPPHRAQKYKQSRIITETKEETPKVPEDENRNKSKDKQRRRSKSRSKSRSPSRNSNRRRDDKEKDKYRDRYRKGERDTRKEKESSRRRSRSRERDYKERRESGRSRDYRESSRDYRDNRYNKRFDRATNKLAHLEKMGIDVNKSQDKKIEGGFMNATLGEASQQNNKDDSRILPPGVTGRLREQMERRKALWQKKEPDEGANQTSAGVNTGKVWQGTTFAHDQEGKQANKFKRLMGIREGTTSGNEKGDSLAKKQEDMFSTMEQQYEVARTATHTMRGVGLGFGSYQR